MTRLARLGGLFVLMGAALATGQNANAAISCERTLVANVVAIDQPLMFNRLGAQNINGMIFALEDDVINTDTNTPLTRGGAAVPGKVQLRPDKRPRPIVLKIAEGECLQVNFRNLLTAVANPRNAPVPQMQINDQVADRMAGFNVQGMEAVNAISDISGYVGANPNSLAAPGGTRSYTLYGAKEGAYGVVSYGATFGADGTAGNISNGLFGSVVVVPKGGRNYRNAVTEEEMRLATVGRTPAGQPIINYEARYPNVEPWISEGKAGKPVLATVNGNRIVHSDGDTIVMGPNADGSFPPSTYPLESQGKRNPAYPNRLEPFRDFSSMWHDEVAAAQAFPGFFNDPVFGHVLKPTRDAFMINYGSGGIGSEIVANRLGVGPMHDCLACAYEEFFLTAYVVGDAAQLVDVPANVGLEGLLPGQAPPPGTTGIKATKALYPHDPANVHHSYVGDFVKFRNTHFGHEMHIFHLHNHQWLFNPNDDNSNYLDAQGIGPGSTYTYEIAFGGSGNRNRSAGDAIFHCHFYPHFAQGMWYMWRISDTFEEGTKLAVSNEALPRRSNMTPGFHSRPFALRDGTPAPGARAYPDGELVVGAPIPAIVPLPGKALPPMPGKVTVEPRVVERTQLVERRIRGQVQMVEEIVRTIVGSVAKIDRSPANYNADGTLKNPGFPFWVAGIETSVGQRPPTPPLDMLTAEKAQQLRDTGKDLWSALDPAQARGWDGGLPRHTLDGRASGGTAAVTVSPLDMKVVVTAAKPIYFPEEGTDAEQAAMAFHAKPEHASFKIFPDGSVQPGAFRTNGAKPMAGSPFAEPCVDDRQVHLTSGTTGQYFTADGQMNFSGNSPFSADNPRVYKGANIQFDVVLNKAGYHFPQQRIIALWQDVWPVINKQQPPEPLVMRLNTFDCAMYYHTTLIPEFYELDDYQIRTPTDIVGQHIHLPKWDLSTTDGAANGWNYEDGTLAPGAVVERIHAIRHFNHCTENDARNGTGACPTEKAHPYFGQFGRPDWMGARTTMQRWFADPILNTHNIDRGLGNIFTHDHYTPSTAQQNGLYATVLTQPAGSTWFHSETGELLYNAQARFDGGPTSWQAVIATGDITGNGQNDSYREFYLQYSDFQHAYEPGVYVGVGPDGVIDRTKYPIGPDSFRYAINPPAKKTVAGAFPDLQIAVAGGQKVGCPTRPCPEAITADDPGIFVVNYRNEPLALRVYDPNRIGPDGKPGMQAAGLAGDLAYAFQSRTDRAIPLMNLAPSAIKQVTGPTGGVTTFPPHINKAGDLPGDPFTPLLRTYSGDNVRIRVQAGGQEEEHNISIHGVKWLQSGSGHGQAPNSGWRNAQQAGISEQYSFMTPMVMTANAASPIADYLYAVDSALEGYWNGAWGILRNYTTPQPDLFPLPNNPRPVAVRNTIAFNGVCPITSPNPVGPGTRPTPQRNYEVVVALANDILPNPLGLTIGQPGSDGMHVGAPLNPNGGTLVYNSRPTQIPAATVIGEDGNQTTIGGKSGPLHDPTAILYVRKSDLDPATGRLRTDVPVEPLVLRAAAGDCINITLENRLPAAMPDLPNHLLHAPIVIRDRFNPQGTTSFNNNLMRPSAHVGLHAQLLATDVTRSDGANVGVNPVQTVPPRAGNTGVFPTRTYQYYAGDIRREGRPVPGQGNNANRNVDNAIATPVEFGGFNLLPADKIKQPQKGLSGAMVVHPAGASWVEDVAMRAAATVQAPGQAAYRDFMVQWHKGLNPRWADGTSVENMATEGLGVPADPKDNSGMAVNYKVEPLWYRFGKAPDAPFGHAGGAGWAAVPNAHMAYSNALVGGDPQTPVFRVSAGSPFRVHLVQASGGSRSGTFGLHGHVWQRDPYLAQNVDALGFPLKDYGVGSVRIGHNPLGMWMAGQESILAATHFSFVFPSAGGGNAIKGDYLMRDLAAFGNVSGRWSIVRVE